MCVSFRCIMKLMMFLNNLKVIDKIIKSAWHIAVSISLSLLIDCILTMLINACPVNVW